MMEYILKMLRSNDAIVNMMGSDSGVIKVSGKFMME